MYLLYIILMGYICFVIYGVELGFDHTMFTTLYPAIKINFLPYLVFSWCSTTLRTLERHLHMSNSSLDTSPAPVCCEQYFAGYHSEGMIPP